MNGSCIGDVEPEITRAFPGADRERYDHHVAHLLDEVTWEAARDFDLVDEMRATIASNAAVLAAGFAPDERPFNNVTTIVVRRGAIPSADRRVGNRRGVQHDHGHIVGISYEGHGPLAFEWRTVAADVARPRRGQNVVYHEFAHKLDQLNGAADGMPPLPSRADESAWIQTLGTNFRRLRRRGSDGLIRNYGATNEGEYFAVVTEVFFTRPAALHAGLPRVYERLAKFYRQNPIQLMAN